MTQNDVLFGYRLQLFDSPRRPTSLTPAGSMMMIMVRRTRQEFLVP
jgi:hypothetical protein